MSCPHIGKDLYSLIEENKDRYTNPASHQVLAMMVQYCAQYLYSGALEQSQYSNANLSRFASFMKIVYKAKGVTIYTPRTH